MGGIENTMMRTAVNSTTDPGQINQSQQNHLAHTQHSPEAALRIHQAEAILRSQAEAALRLAVSQAAAVAASSTSSSNNNLNNNINSNNMNTNHNISQPNGCSNVVTNSEHNVNALRHHNGNYIQQNNTGKFRI